MTLWDLRARLRGNTTGRAGAATDSAAEEPDAGGASAEAGMEGAVGRAATNLPSEPLAQQISPADHESPL